MKYACYFGRRLLFFFCGSILIGMFACAFDHETFILTVNGSVPIGNLQPGSSVIPARGDCFAEAEVVEVVSKRYQNFYEVTVENFVFHIAPNQQLYDPKIEKWITPAFFNDTTYFIDKSGSWIRCLGTRFISGDCAFYKLWLRGPHTFYVTEGQLLAHNFAPAVGACFAWGGGSICLESLSLGLGLIGIKLFRDSKKKKRFSISLREQPTFPSLGGGPNGPEDDENFLRRLKRQASKKANSRFGKLHKDPDSGFWWSRDRSGHAGASFKVFKETSKGFRWVFDADAKGARILSKHKGPVGLFIPKKEVALCP